MFFIISGFVIWLTTCNKKINMREFILKRIIRVVPLYWFITLMIVIAGTLIPELFSKTRFEPVQTIQSLLFIPHYSLGFPGKIWPILVPGWTLNYEIFFYLIFGLLLFIPINRSLVLFLFFSTLVFIGVITESENALFKTYTNNLLLEFVAGVYIAKAFLDGRLNNRPLSLAISICVFGIFLLLTTVNIDSQNSVRAIYWGVPAALIVIGAIMIEGSGTLPRSRILHLLGDASYSIYLAHTYTLTVLRIMWSKLVSIEATTIEIILFACLGLIVSSISGILLHLLIEKPLTNYLRRIFSTR